MLTCATRAIDRWSRARHATQGDSDSSTAELRPLQSAESRRTAGSPGPSRKGPGGAFGIAGRRALTKDEEQKLLALLPEMYPRDRALVTTQGLTGFRISEVLSLTYGSVWRGDEMLPVIGVAPAHLKGGYGRTRWIPILPELQRALQKLRHWLWLRFDLRHDLPLFVSRERDARGYPRPLSREQARCVVMRAFENAGIRNDGQLGTHTLRKTWARNVYDASGKDIMVLRDALGHADIGTSQKYLDVGRDRVLEAIWACSLNSAPTPRRLSAQKQRGVSIRAA